MLFRCSCLAATLLACLSLTGCEAKSDNQTADVKLPAASPTGSGNAPSNSTAFSQVSEAEAQVFAEAWEKSINENDLSAFQQLVDWEGIFGRVIDSFDVTPRFRAGFMRGTVGVSKNLFQSLSKIIADGGSYKLVNILDRQGETHCVFRLILPEAGMNYHDLRLVKKNGQVIGNYFFVALTGQSISDTMRNIAAVQVSAQKSFMSRLTGAAKQATQSLKLQKEMIDAVQYGQHDQALKIYASLPESTQQEKIPMLYRVMASISLESSEYLQAIDDYTARFPGDASLGLVAMDAAFLRKDSALLQTSHQAIQTWTGGDPLVDLMIGTVLVQFGDIQKAIELTKDIDPESTGIFDAHDYKCTIALSTNDHDETLKQLRAMRDNFDFEFTALSELEDWQGFVASPQYTEWLNDTAETEAY